MSLTCEYKVLFIISSKSGGGRQTRKAKTLAAEAFRAASIGIEPEIIMTDHAGHAGKVAREFANKYQDKAVIYVCGGDGTTNDVTQVLANTTATMGVIPIGTANDLAKTLYGRHHKLEHIIAATPYPEIRHTDLIQINNDYCINVTSFGYDTTVLEAVYGILNKHPHLGSSAYPLAIIKTLFTRPGTPVKIDCLTTTGERIQSEHNLILAAICNGAYYGGGFNPAPTAKIDDGCLHLMLAERMGLLNFLPLIFRYKKGTHLSSRFIDLFDVVSGTIEHLEGENLQGNNDGEVFSTPKIRFELLPKALSFAFLPV